MTAYATTKTEIKAQFFDVDSMDIVWHGNYVKYFEMARCDLLDAIDYNYQQMKDSGYGWPVIDLRVRYIRPVVFGQVVIVESQLVEYENRLKIDYVIYDKETGERLCKGSTVQVAVELETKEMLLASPSVLVEKLEEK